MKHLLYFAGYRMVVFRWERGVVTGIAEFEPDQRGFAAFETLMRREVRRPVPLVIDIIEEDFRLTSAPHLIGRDRLALEKRLLTRYFRQYSHTCVRRQGRKSGGRQDDVLLLSALTNPRLFQPWLDILEKVRTPLEGIYSLPLIGEALLKPLGALKQNALVISQQVPGSIRQSFYVQGRLKLSRLSPSGDDMHERHEALHEETRRTVRYLETQQYADTRQKLNIYVIVPANEIEPLRRMLRPDTRKEYHIVDKDALARSMGIKVPVPGRFSHWLFGHVLLGHRWRKPHYATPADQRYFHHYRAKTALYSLSGFGTALIVFWSVWTALDIHTLSTGAERMERRALEYNRGYEAIINEISEVDLDVEDVRDAVNLAEKLKTRYAATPVEFMRAVSETLRAYPNIHLKRIQWVQTHNNGHSFGETREAADSREGDRRRNQSASSLYRKSLIEATVTDYENNPRLAVEAVERFARELRRGNAAYSVEVVQMPFDIDPSSRFIGEALSDVTQTAEATGADFTFVMSREVPL